MTKNHKLLVFHDETKFSADVEYKGHILFFIPEHLIITSQTPLFGVHTQECHPIKSFGRKLYGIRESYSFDRKLHFTDISGKTWYRDDAITRQINDLATDALRSKGCNSFSNSLNCKMAIIFFSADTDLSLYGGEVRKEKRLRHHETVLRILLKGALHYLYTDDDLIEVKSIISDGDPFHRKLDDQRIIWRITYDGYEGRSSLQENISFHEDAKIIQIPSDHKEHDALSDDWINANLLQISDMLLGSTIRSCYIGCKDYQRGPRLNSKVDDKKGIIAFPVKRMLSKVKRGHGFKYSGHNKSFSVSYIDFQDENIFFNRLNPIESKIDTDSFQLKFTTVA